MLPERQGNSKFIENANKYLIEQKDNKITKYSAEEYFVWLLSHGIAARLSGNYGISAAFVARIKGIEMIFFGKNTVITSNDPFGHAEMNAVRSAVDLLKLRGEKQTDLLKNKEKRGEIMIRKAPHNETENLLYSTLEPCPMCTAGAVINSGLQKVVVGIPDAFGGQLEESRLNALSPIWKEMAESHKLIVTFAQSTDPSEKYSYVPLHLLSLLNDLFFETKKELDLIIATKPRLEIKSLENLGSSYLKESSH